MKKYKTEILLIVTISFIVLLDQSIKYFVSSSMELVDSIHLIRNFFRITYVQNTGAAWSLFSGNTLFLIFTGIITILIIGYIYFKDKNNGRWNFLLYGTLLGGILGNLIDRIHLGYVIDYIDFNFGGYHFPIFNLADIFIVVSILFLVIKIMKEEKDES